MKSIVANAELASNVREFRATFAGRGDSETVVVLQTVVNVKRMRICDYYNHLETPPWLDSFNIAVSETKAPLSNSFYHLAHLSISCGRVSLA